MSHIIDNIEYMDEGDFRLIAQCDAPVAVNHVKNNSTLGGLHCHNFYELTIILGGSCKYDFQGITHTLTDGDTFITPPGEKHCYHDQKNLSLINFIWYPDNLPIPQSVFIDIPGYRTFFELKLQSRSVQNFKYRLHISQSQTSMLRFFYSRIEEVLQSRSSGFQLQAGLIFSELLIVISRFYNEKMKKKTDSNDELQKIEKVLRFLDEHFSEPISRSQVAKIYGSSESTFSRSFKKTMQESFFEYLLNLRLQHAQQLLLESDKSIYEIAVACGFCDSNYLCYRFRLKYGMPPHQFRLTELNSNLSDKKLVKG